MATAVSLYGIRHHGPGCARSLVKALDAQHPDCVVIEGPAGCEALLTHVLDTQLKPPVALLSHCVDDPQLAVFYPLAEFSPEWQALRWAAQANVPVRFMDVAPGISLAWQRQQKERHIEALAAKAKPSLEPNDEAPIVEDQETSPGIPADADTPGDPLDWLARAAGYGDGESWWNHMVEERGDGEGLFDAIAQAMTELRENAQVKTGLDAEQEAIREAHMRGVLREARQAHQSIAVVCGAWHVPALAGKTTAAADQRLMKGVEKLKAQTTWVPWTYRHLSARSGYGAGVASPGWYDHLWRSEDGKRAIGWFARVARLLREKELDCSSAHLIEASRLSDTLAALRERPAPGLDEINEATRCVICNGDDAPMRLIAERLMIGDALGSVPPNVPTVPLQRDLEAQQRRLRLKPEALSRTLDLDLRNDNDLQRSHLLHRLCLLGIHWGSLTTTGQSARGTFHEVWDLAWQPSFEVELIIASRYGHTLDLAATARAAEQAQQATRLSELAGLVDVVLLANLPGAVEMVSMQLEARAATEGDPLALLGALPALANIHRYGNVRRTDVRQVAHVFDSMLVRAGLSLPLALADLDGEAAESARNVVLGADRAIDLRQGETQMVDWRRALRVVALAESMTPLLSGVCTRLLFDVDALSVDEVRQQLTLNLSQGAEALAAAQWLDGFLNRNATVLLHGETVWALLDQWLSALADEHFIRVVPLVRRTFAAFESADRRDLSERVRQPAQSARSAAAPMAWNEERANRALPLLRELLGLTNDG